MISSSNNILYKLFVEREDVQDGKSNGIQSKASAAALQEVPEANPKIQKRYLRRSKSNESLRMRDLQRKRRQAATSKDNILDNLEQSCGCKNQCNTKLSLYDILRWRQRIHCLPQGEKRNTELMDIIRKCAFEIKKHKKAQFFRVEQQTVCRQFFIGTVLGISVSTFTRAYHEVTEGKFSSNLPERRSEAVQGTRGKVCEGFIRAYMESTCDRDPTGKRFLMAISLKRQDIFNLYRTIHRDDHLQQSQFYDILKFMVPELTFTTTHRLTKCTECADFRFLIEQEVDIERKLELMEMRNAHLRTQQLEREGYYTRRGQAECMPSRYFSIILDGMDQHKTNLPHYAGWKDPDEAGPKKLKSHIVGGLCHGRQTYFFLDWNQFPHDTNLTLTCFLHILQNEARDGRLPPTLYVQLDNTVRENKNRYFIGMMAYLIKKDIFREVFMSFLLVGHTHEDVDQVFSKISQTLVTRDTLTPDSLKLAIKESQERRSLLINDTTYVWNISAWLEPFVNMVHNVSFPKLYRIYKDDTNHVIVKFKPLSTSPEWHPTADERALEIFKLDENSFQLIPEGCPPVVLPSFDAEELEDLSRQLIAKDFKLARYKEESVNEWQQFFENANNQHAHPVWPLSALKECVVMDVGSSLTQKESDLIEKYQKKRTQFKEVFTTQPAIGRKRGVHADRRLYIVGEMVVVILEGNKVVCGKVELVEDDTLQVLSKTTNKTSSRGEKNFSPYRSVSARGF